MPPRQKQKKRILLVHTGGTIGMGLPRSPQAGGALAPDDQFLRHLHRRIPELKDLADVGLKALCNKDSSQITPADWVALATLLAAHDEAYDGFVVTHGTDTMAFTATALSYLRPFPCKPVVFTGSQRPLGEIRTDARRNLICSVAFAASQKALEVSVFFDTLLLRANRAVKVHIEEFHAFDSPNYPWLGEERLHTRVKLPSREAQSRPALNPLFDGRVQVVHAFPGAQVALDEGARAVVILAFGCGNLPLDDSSVLKLLKRARKKQVPVVLTSQVTAGATQPEIYEMGRKALDLGAISAGDMTFAATLVKAMMLAGNRVPYERWPRLMGCNWAGEISVAKESAFK